MRRVISNSSALIHLAKIGQLDLLVQQFGQIVIPEAVWREVVEEGAESPDARAVAEASWITVQKVSPSPLLTNLRSMLDAGESEAIALAIQDGADLVLLDEDEARRVASVHNLPHTGLVGVLLAAKTAGRIPSMKDCLDRLADTGFRLSKSLRIQILRSVQETENQ